MAAGVVIDQGGNPWKLTYTSNTSVGGGSTLPALLCQYDLIPKRVRWMSPTAAQGDQVIIDDVQGRVCYEEGPATGADFEPVEQRPRLHEKWIGYYNPAVVPGVPANTDVTATPGIAIKRFDSGTLLIYI
jgi:hypothetical protein